LIAYLQGDGLKLAYRCWGDAAAGPPIVLLHGITETAAVWEAVAAALAPERRVIAFDARGHGGSDWSAEEAYAPDHHFADLVTALAALDAGPCVLAGFSMGGAVATMTAACRPDLVRALVVVDAYPAPELSPGSRRIAELLAAGYHEGMASYFGGCDPAIARRMRDDLLAGEARRLDLWPLWEALRVPALVVRGALSDVLTAATAAEMIARQPRARLLEVAGVGHQIPSLRPRQLASAILGCALAPPQ
jgi:pimeloyl-ACP methyl ester carboxylesterase